MKKNNEIQHGRHYTFLMHVHLVFVTKYRRGLFTKEILSELRSIFSSVCIGFETELVEKESCSVGALDPALKGEVCRAKGSRAR